MTARESLFDEDHRAGFRLFNGFTEGESRLVIDLYARTALIHNYADPPSEGESAAAMAQEFIRTRLPWVRCILVKTRSGDAVQKRGRLVYGDQPDDRICEGGVWYALNLTLNRDASLYLDTRHLRRWARENLAGQRVLNTFAYTGSLGVAAMAGGAARVVHVDLNRDFLNLAKTSYTLNGFPIRKADFLAADFWAQVGRFKRSGELFDCVLLDPPFFAETPRAALNLQYDSARLINKVRPLVRDGGWLVAVNNAVFLSGKEYLQTLETLCADGYLQIETFIPVPEDFCGYPKTWRSGPPVDPAPFNHATKIAVLRVQHSGKLR